jgi:biotin carboxylase
MAVAGGVSQSGDLRFESVEDPVDAAAAAARIGFPVVVKPVGLSGSQGVIRADDEAAALAAAGRAAAIAGGGPLLVEEFVAGAEGAVEGLLRNSTLEILAVFDKPDPLEGPFFEETIYVTPSRLGTVSQAAIAEHIRQACQAVGLWHGPVHAECRVAADGAVYVLEVAARPIGGLCSRVLVFRDWRNHLGSLEEVLLRHAVGEPIANWTRETAAAAVMMIPIPSRGMYKGVEGESAACAVPGVTDVRITAKVGQVLETLPEAGSYLGFIFSKGNSPDDAESAVRTAHRKLSFAIARELYCLP